MKGKTLNTIGLVVLAAIGLMGILFRIQHWPFSKLLMSIGFLGFPILYGSITWPIGKRIPDGEWWGTIGVMVLFAIILLSR